jgi:hypothetical protein
MTSVNYKSEMLYSVGSCVLYYKHTTILNYASSIVNKLEALLTGDSRVVIYDCHVFIVHATEVTSIPFLWI